MNTSAAVKTALQTVLMSIAALQSMPFADACDNWLESRRYHIAPRTYQDYSNYIKILSKYFESVRLPDIDGDMVRAYQHDRMKRAGPTTINKELGIIIQIRKRINRPLEDYQPLQQSKNYEEPGRALTPSEEARLERTCKVFSTHEKWGAAACGLLLSMRTGMRRCEILSLKLKDVHLGNPSILEIPRRGAKRVSSERPIVLVGDAEFAMEKLIQRCREACGGFMPDHYLIPFRRKDHSYDPERPARHYRAGIDHLFSVAEIENFRPHDCRHHATSKLLKNPRVSLPMAVKQLGWINPKMVDRYFHGNLENLILMAQALDQKKPVQNEGYYQRKYLNQKESFSS